MKLEAPGLTAPLVVDAEVLWSQGGDLPGVGVRFVGVTADVRSQIDDLIDRLSRQVAESRHAGL